MTKIISRNPCVGYDRATGEARTNTNPMSDRLRFELSLGQCNLKTLSKEEVEALIPTERLKRLNAEAKAKQRSVADREAAAEEVRRQGTALGKVDPLYVKLFGSSMF